MIHVLNNSTAAGSSFSIDSFGVLEENGTNTLLAMVINTNGDVGYRFSFNGMMKDNEIKGDGNNIIFKHRVYDNRLGKFLSVDPLFKTYPANSSYAFAENDVIRSIDLEGAEKYIVTLNGIGGRGWVYINPNEQQWNLGLMAYEGEKNSDGSRIIYQQAQMPVEQSAINSIETSRKIQDEQRAAIKSNESLNKDDRTIALNKVQTTVGESINYSITPTFGPSNSNITNLPQVASSLAWLNTRLQNNSNLNVNISANLGSSDRQGNPTPAQPLSSSAGPNAGGISNLQLSINRGNAVRNRLTNNGTSLITRQVSVTPGISLSGAQNRFAQLSFTITSGSTAPAASPAQAPITPIKTP